MKINAELEGGRLQVDIWELLGSATGEERTALVCALACHDGLFDEVANQLIDGWTSDGSHGSVGAARHTAYGGIDRAVRRIAKASSEIARKEIERLEAALKHEEAQRNVGWDAYHRLLDSRRFG
jgi:hypothetical protein